ncbi:MAG: hypothetical protein K940chlam3_00705 [Chlamydiae bacterium]|nr:hypothetical protein [Chlamydiota bacterium]
MARKDVKKFTFIGVKDQRDEFFRRAQKIGIVHFIDMHAQKAGHLPQEIQDYIQAIKVLRSQPVVKQEEPVSIERSLEIAKRVLELKHDIESKEEQLRVLHLEISRVQEFGEFNLDDIAYIEKEGKRKFQFYCAKKGLFEGEEIPENLIYINSDHGLDYFAGINPEPKYYDKMVDMVFEHSLSELSEQVNVLQEAIRLHEIETKELAKYNTFLHHALALSYNNHNLKLNKNFSREVLEDSLFAVEGWVPVNLVDELNKIVGELGIYQEEIVVEETDTIPTYLENSGVSRIGEDLVNIYDTPSHTDKDPSLWILSAFALFFAMIVNDAGYGLIYLAIALFLRYKFPNAPATGKRVINLMTILCVFCIIWGTLTTSFFGINIGVDNPLRKLSLLTWLSEKKVEYHIQYHDETFQEYAEQYPEIATARTGKEFFKGTEVTENEVVTNKVLDNVGRNILLELALLTGIIHISLSFLRYLGRNLSGIGWIMVLVGGYLYFPHYLGVTSLLHYVFGVPSAFGATEGLQLIYAGIGVAVVLAIIQHRLGGLAEVMNLIQVFADVLSYLRLYALGLASAIVSETINELYGAVPILIAIVLISLAHMVNMLLGIMGGVIHGLRLNFLEWYHYSFEGGGKPFNPLRLYEVE